MTLTGCTSSVTVALAIKSLLSTSTGCTRAILTDLHLVISVRFYGKGLLRQILWMDDYIMLVAMVRVHTMSFGWD